MLIALGRLDWLVLTDRPTTCRVAIVTRQSLVDGPVDDDEIAGSGRSYG